MFYENASINKAFMDFQRRIVNSRLLKKES